MKVFTRLTVVSSFLMFVSSFIYVLAANQGEGVVRLKGAIVESACGLDAASADQTIEMAPDSVGRLLRHAEGKPHPFQLRLVDCSLSRPDPSSQGNSLPDWQHIQVTFDGDSDRGGRSFATFGDSQGVALHIADAFGQESTPGEPMPMHPVTDGDITLHYTIRLIGNGRPLVAGTHSAAVRFKLDYY